MSTIILGIESSCDDTSAAVIKDGFLLSNVVSSQEVHEGYGGVVPELASRADEQNIVPVVHEGLKVQILESLGDWYNVRMADGNEGWILKTDLEKI